MVSSELGIEKLMFNDFLLGNNDVLGQKLQETLLISLKIAGEDHLIYIHTPLLRFFAEMSIRPAINNFVGYRA